MAPRRAGTGRAVRDRVVDGQASSPERRRDARVSVLGRVRVGRPDAGRTVEGRLLDVSAGGLRLAWPGAGPPRGSTLALEVRLQPAGDPDGPPRVVLDGAGRVAWVGTVHEGAAQVGVAFDRPLAVRRPFPDVQIF